MSEQDAVIDFLAAGAGNAQDAGGAERIDTHASIVFLIGERAFKLKRAVRYSYLDYSTPALREAACRAEYEINRRIAPALYLGVRALRRRANGAVGFDGDGETLDWVVEMRRFDAAGLFDRLAEAERLDEPLLRRLADAIAAFHEQAAPVADAGGSAALARVIAGNTDNLRAAGNVFDRDAVTRLDRAARAALERVAGVIEARRRQGKVRHCHGDLHLGNICLVDGTPTLFDAVEFSAEISAIDVLYDLAFVLMDLIHRGLAPGANLVMNRYLDITCDDDGAGLLPLFMALRAAIRAHVTAAAAAQQPKPAKRQEQRRTAQLYLALAESLLAPAKPRLVAIGGLSGSGKSTFARALAADLPPPPGARLLRTDVLRKALLDAAPETRLHASAYSHAMNRQTYARLEHEAARLLAAGASVIMDATFIEAQDRAAAAQVAQNHGAPFTGIWLEAPPEMMMTRLAERQGDASDADRAVLEQQLLADPGPMAWRRVDSAGPLARVASAVRRAAGVVPRDGR
jgi:uncharacterized protein